MGKIDIRETRLRHMAEELHEIGVPIPDYKGKSKDTSIPAGPTLHHWIAQDSDRRIALDISLFQHQHDGDPAIKVKFSHQAFAESDTTLRILGASFVNISVTGCGLKPITHRQILSRIQTRYASRTTVSTAMRPRK